MVNQGFSSVLAAWPLFLSGLWLTIILAAVSCIAGTVLGMLCAWGIVQGPGWLRRPLRYYVELFRNTPFIIQVFFIYFGLASVGLKMTAVPASLVALTLNLGAYACEIGRAGLEATPRGQVEAAESLALSRWQIFRYVLIPPALARVWPALVSQLVIMMLASSVCSQISAEELSYQANFVAGKTFRSFESFSIVTGIYLLLAIIQRKLLLWAGPRFLFGQVKF
ncbi:MAG: amino acid ABC transporter permease [Burkholderiaceae bacterium]|nr:amino acid ABC transporter permease [Burkholderiaceae bacterium]